MKNINKNIIISRTDSIGDVILTFPVAAVLKKKFPEITIVFLGKEYTKPVIDTCKYIDQFIDEETFFQETIYINGILPEAIIHVFPSPKIAKRAKELKIPLRIGTTNRLYHWLTCNKLIKLSRKNSNLHESQLNLKLLSSLGIETDYSLTAIEELFGLEKLELLGNELISLIEPDLYNLILHPKSQGSGREWPLQYYISLIKSLDKQKVKLFVSGTQKEKASLKPLFDEVGTLVTDITGRMSLRQFISFINLCNGLIASSTGPIHLAATLGKDALGIYPPIRPLHPDRWKPIGPKAKIFVELKNCSACRKKNNPCLCMAKIKPETVKDYLDELIINL